MDSCCQTNTFQIHTHFPDTFVAVTVLFLSFCFSLSVLFLYAFMFQTTCVGYSDAYEGLFKPIQTSFIIHQRLESGVDYGITIEGHPPIHHNLFTIVITTTTTTVIYKYSI